MHVYIWVKNKLSSSVRIAVSSNEFYYHHVLCTFYCDASRLIFCHSLNIVRILLFFSHSYKFSDLAIVHLYLCPKSQLYNANFMALENIYYINLLFKYVCNQQNYLLNSLCLCETPVWRNMLCATYDMAQYMHW